MPERLNLHVDESGTQDLAEGLYLVAVVLHEHDADISGPIRAYEERLSLRPAGVSPLTRRPH